MNLKRKGKIYWHQINLRVVRATWKSLRHTYLQFKTEHQLDLSFNTFLVHLLQNNLAKLLENHEQEKEQVDTDQE